MINCVRSVCLESIFTDSSLVYSLTAHEPPILFKFSFSLYRAFGSKLTKGGNSLQMKNVL